VPGGEQIVQGGLKNSRRVRVPRPHTLHACVFGSYAGYAHVMDWITNGYITFYATFIFVSSCYQLAIESNYFHGCKITVFNDFVIDLSLFVVNNTL